jgi:hypothetical protein
MEMETTLPGMEMPAPVLKAMISKWKGTCRECGATIRPGAPILWAKALGARHATPEDCAAALVYVAPPLKEATPEDPADQARAYALIAAASWKAAKSQAIPHEYALRKLWANDADFIWLCEHIKAHGYDQQFARLGVFRYYDAGGYQYFWCGTDPRLPGDVGLINRAKKG